MTHDKTKSHNPSGRDDTPGRTPRCTPHWVKIKTTTSIALTVKPHTVRPRKNPAAIPRRAFSIKAARSVSSPDPRANDARSSAKAAAQSCRNSLSRDPVAVNSVPPGAERLTAPAVSASGEGAGASCPAYSARLRNSQKMQRTGRREKSKIVGNGKAG